MIYFVVSIGGLSGLKAKAFLKRFAKLLAKEKGKPYSIVRVFVNPRMLIAHVRIENRCISDMSNRSRWEGGAGL